LARLCGSKRVKGILLWLIGIPIPVIILLYLFIFR
jgi:TM2 domain-containing membrane protein YozV